MLCWGNFVNNETKLRSMSIGKTMVSYVMGHAICRGYIDSVDSRLNDWSLTKNTLYENQNIIHLLGAIFSYIGHFMKLVYYVSRGYLHD